jgi:hypothetical protein
VTGNRKPATGNGESRGTSLLVLLSAIARLRFRPSPVRGGAVQGGERVRRRERVRRLALRAQVQLGLQVPGRVRVRCRPRRVHAKKRNRALPFSERPRRPVLPDRRRLAGHRGGGARSAPLQASARAAGERDRGRLRALAGGVRSQAGRKAAARHRSLPPLAPARSRHRRCGALPGMGSRRASELDRSEEGRRGTR